MELEERQNHAKAALTAYAASKGEPLSNEGITAENFADLLADLRHLAHASELPWPLIELRAKRHYEAEARPGDDHIRSRPSASR